MPAPTWVSGTKLCPADQLEACRAFVHRYTREHVPGWARDLRPDGERYPVQLDSDADWLAHTMFAVRADGRLDRRVKRCESSPTWPDGKGTWGERGKDWDRGD